MYVVQTRNLTKEFKRIVGKRVVTAVEDISFGIKKGEILGLLGPNGAGKSTILKMICGLLKPTRGEIFINGRRLEGHRSLLLSRIGAVLEGSRNSLWSMTVRQNLAYFAYLKNIHGKNLKNRGEELLHFFELERQRNEVVKNLSSGMKQKLAIVLALISDPDLILLDEPTVGLDVQATRLVKQRITELAKQENRTILITTHQMEIVEEISDRVAIINKGRLIALEKTQDILNNVEREYYVIKLRGRPDTKRLKDIPPVREVKLIQDVDKEEFFLHLALAAEDSLHGVLGTLHSQNHVEILSINKSEPNLEDVFVRMVEN